MEEGWRALIEGWLPVALISQESQREKSLRKGHLSTLHQWWSRKPLVASRAAVFAALTRDTPEHSSLLEELCQRDFDPQVLERAQSAIHELHGGAPAFLDPFSGGGSIPLEALRLGCQVHANDLNPVAFVLLLSTLKYPSRWGEPLLSAVEQWGQWLFDRVHEEIGDLYKAPPKPPGDNPNPLIPSAYLWTRTVPCPNPTCGGPVPMLRKSWLSRRSRRFIALQLHPDKESRTIGYSVVYSKADKEADAVAEWGFDPGAFAKGGHGSCLFCQAGVVSSYVREQGKAGQMGLQLMAMSCSQKGRPGKQYFTVEEFEMPVEGELQDRLDALCQESGLSLPDEALPPPGSLGVSVQNYGMSTWSDLYTTRQLLAMLTFCKWLHKAHEELLGELGARDWEPDEAAAFARAVATYLAFGITKLANRGSSLVIYNPRGEKLESPISNGRMSFNWDVAESNPVGQASGNFVESMRYTTEALRSLCFATEGSAEVSMGPAQWLDLPDASIDAIVTDPPYYDNVPYSSLADYFYIWFKRILGPLYEEPFRLPLSPRRRELVVDRLKHKGDKIAARDAFQEGMAEALSEMHRVLRPEAPLVLIYAHKTTFGWSSLIDALRAAGFEITEAWPLATERAARLRAQRSAALASSIFMVARKRSSDDVGELMRDVYPELKAIVEQRVEELFSLGIQGADLVIACVGAGLRAFTRFRQVERTDGAPMDTASFLQEVQGEVVQQVLSRVMGIEGESSGSIDPLSQLYAMSRFQFQEADIAFDEANVLARGVGLELERYFSGKHALLRKSGRNIELRDFRKRGEHLTQLHSESPLIDLLHRLLWLLEHELSQAKELFEAHPHRGGALRLLAQALSGRMFSPKQRSAEQKQIDVFLAMWASG